jgi:nucleotide-binding universal stress UspA family protein
MIDFRRILFPVDFSDQSRAVAPFVAAMAQCFDSEITVLHVIDVPASDEASGINRAQADATVAIDQFIAQQFSRAAVFPTVIKGDAAQQIVAYAHEQHTGLIMMPTHGYGPFRALLLGSVTAKVLHDVHCPVWTGIHAENMMSHSADRWKRLLCAVDTNEHGEAVLKWAWEFARTQNLELHVVHAVSGAGGVFTEQNDPSMYEFLFDVAREQVAKLQARAGTECEVHLMEGSVGNAVHRAALECEADLIVIGRGAIHSSLGRLKNSSYRIVQSAPCPVISI